MNTNTPAILGGKPAFNERLQMVKPVLPTFAEITESVSRILNTGMITKGQYMRDFENAVAEYLGVRNAVAVSSCTSGMMLVHKCLGLTGEVIVPSFTFMASASAIVWAGLTPVFADVDRHTNNLDPQAAEAAITPRTSAIVAVHQFGNPPDIAALEDVAKRHNLKLIFDAAHGFGAKYQGVPVGCQGDAQIYSLSPTKLLVTGEGGIVATNDDKLAEMIRMGREYGNDGNYDSAFAGLNARMPEFNAILGLFSLSHLEEAATHRNETIAIFQEALGQIPGIGFQQVRDGDRHSYRELSLTIDAQAFGLSRNELVQALAAENIDSRKYYDPPIHKQTAYRPFYHDEPLPNTDWLADHSISLPLWSHMSDEIALTVCQSIRSIHENAESIHQKLSQK